jgi:hypothetical protein
VDLHGYVPWIMWPWAHIPDLCDDHATFYDIGVEIRDRIAAAGGGTYDIGTIYDVAYPVSGCSTNYSYGELGLWAFGIEVVDDDMPNICQEFLDGMLHPAEWIWDNDCNGNGVADSEDISGGTSLDDNSNGIPDECEDLADCPGDLDGNGFRDFTDFNMFADAYGSQPGDPDWNPDADLDDNGFIDFTDFNIFADLYGTPCP